MVSPVWVMVPTISLVVGSPSYLVGTPNKSLLKAPRYRTFVATSTPLPPMPSFAFTPGVLPIAYRDIHG